MEKDKTQISTWATADFQMDKAELVRNLKYLRQRAQDKAETLRVMQIQIEYLLNQAKEDVRQIQEARKCLAAEEFYRCQDTVCEVLTQNGHDYGTYEEMIEYYCERPNLIKSAGTKTEDVEDAVKKAGKLIDDAKETCQWLEKSLNNLLEGLKA